MFGKSLNRDVVGGVLMFGIGIAVAIHSMSLHLGSLSQMGPGYFPFALGAILTVVGLAIAVQGRLSPPAEEEKEQHGAEWKAWFLICLGVMAFVVLARYLGLVVATFAVVFISALGDRKNTWRSAALLAIALVGVAIVVFWWALQIQLPLFKWGFA
ncbi:hypothetical protein NOV72_02041 [Caballeronia novacaledonica]|uniref:DUF1468 domain-containing protein n=1 Tax=Caballeronia novacaledonica TaxID=1544861 RepID=A0A2U3I3W1_9BURK|nr:tripartite tricarboxylate transporter TctB family protein [Caballeronia novacaledonica]SPB14810.1 hypothetical protein NOV72_02041 [Caballeronia novacaledonica]